MGVFRTFGAFGAFGAKSTLTLLAVLCVLSVPLTGCASRQAASLPASAPAMPAPASAIPTLDLPASFVGTLPCRDCKARRVQLDLWPDGVFHLTHLDPPPAGKANATGDDIGRWRRVPERSEMLLYGGREMPVSMRVVGPRTLRPLGIDGEPAGREGAHDLVREGAQGMGSTLPFKPAEPSLMLHGMFSYFADAPGFVECLTGRSYPVALEGDYLALERAYGAARAAPGAPLMASFEGRIAGRPPMEGPRPVPTVVVSRFVGVWPSQQCERAMSRASLGDQYWRIASLGGQRVAATQGQREPHVVLHARQGRYAATAGCARIEGAYRVEGEGIAFERPASRSAHACPADAGDPMQSQERALQHAMEQARRWRIHAQVLEWFDAGGRTLAVFEAVYLR